MLRASNKKKEKNENLDDVTTAHEESYAKIVRGNVMGTVRGNNPYRSLMRDDVDLVDDVSGNSEPSNGISMRVVRDLTTFSLDVDGKSQSPYAGMRSIVERLFEMPGMPLHCMTRE